MPTLPQHPQLHPQRGSEWVSLSWKTLAIPSNTSLRLTILEVDRPGVPRVFPLGKKRPVIAAKAPFFPTLRTHIFNHKLNFESHVGLQLFLYINYLHGFKGFTIYVYLRLTA